MSNTHKQQCLNGLVEPQCQYFVLRKKRLCRMTVRPGRQYCGEHEPQPKTSDGQDDRRIPCPNDPKHTVYVSKLEKHLSICNARATEQPPYIVPNINAPSEVDACLRKPLSELSRDTLMQVIDKVNFLYDKYVKDNITTAPEQPIHTAVMEEFSESERAETSLRHLRQVSSLLWLAEREGLVQDNTCYVELGAGKGHVSYYLCNAWCSGATSSGALLVDRASLRHKRDNKLRARSHARLRADLAHLALERVPRVQDYQHVVGLAKHLCGVATDFALRCVCGAGVARRVRGVVLATCCHHRCLRAHYVANRHLQELGITGDEMNVMLGIVSWATCGDGRSRDRRSDQINEPSDPANQRHESYDPANQRHEPYDPADQRHEPYDPASQRHEPYDPADQHREPYDPADQRHEPYEPAIQRHEPYDPAKQRHEPYDPADQHRKPYDPADQRHEPYDPANQRHEPYDPANQHREPYDPADQRHEPYDPASQRHEPYDPADQHREPYDPADQRHEPYEPAIQQHEPYDPAKQHREPYNPPDQRYAPYDPANQCHEPYDPVNQRHKPYDPAEQHREPYDPANQRHEPYDPTKQRHEPYDPTDQRHEPYDPANQRHDSSAAQCDATNHDPARASPTTSEEPRAPLAQEFREEVGRRAKQLIDWGRVLYLREQGFDARLCYFVPTAVSLENVCIVAKKLS